MQVGHEVRVPMSCTATPADIADRWLEVLAVSRYNRELVRLVADLEWVRDKLAAFAARDVAAELVRGWRAAGNPRVNVAAPATDADETAAGFVEEARAVQRAAAAMAWCIANGVPAFEEVALPVPGAGG